MSPDREGSRRRGNGAPPDMGRAIDRIIVNLWQTIEDLERLQPEESRFFRVTIFGSARITASDELYTSVRETAASLARLGCDIVTGGGPGLMAAANEGAKAGDPTGRIRSIGLTIELPNLEEGPNPYLDRITAHRTFFSRLHHFMRMSQAFLIFPGGIGTALESFMTWQLLQVGMIRERPLVFVGEHWNGLLAWMRESMLAGGYVGARDFDLLRQVKDPRDAVAVVAEAKAAFDQRRRALLEQEAARRAATVEIAPRALDLPSGGGMPRGSGRGAADQDP